jgi:hypothetical protein
VGLEVPTQALKGEATSIPPVSCRPWCHDGDGHPHEVVEADTVCWSPGTYVDLELESGASVLTVSRSRAVAGRWQFAILATHRRRAEEARVIAAVLVAVAGEIE